MAGIGLAYLHKLDWAGRIGFTIWNCEPPYQRMMIEFSELHPIPGQGHRTDERVRMAKTATKSAPRKAAVKSAKNGQVVALSSKTPAPMAVAKAVSQQLPKHGSPVPMLDLSRQYAAIQPEVTQAMQRVCASQQYILGPEVQQFEQSAAAFLGVAQAIGCASGTDAIWLAVAAAGIGPGCEVITTPFSFFASASAILRSGAKPVFTDVDPETLNLDPMAVERRVREYPSDKLRAVMPVHLYGQCANMDDLERVASAYKLTILEDAAQAFGASWRGKRAGALGKAAAFSFYPTKNLSCFGDGGLMTSNDPEVADRARLLRVHGSRRRYYHEEIGWNSRLDALQAAVLRVKLRHLEDWNTRRNHRAEAYNVLFRSSGLLQPRTAGEKASAPVRLLAHHHQAYHIYHQYVVRVQKRDELRAFLADRQIGSEIYYPVPLHLQKCFAYLGYGEGDLPESERAAKEVLALPMFPELMTEEQASVVSAIADFYS